MKSPTVIANRQFALLRAGSVPDDGVIVSRESWETEAVGRQARS